MNDITSLMEDTSFDQISSFFNEKKSYQGDLGTIFFEGCKKEIFQNIISQFGLSNAYDNYKKGGHVDTIHNVRNDVFATKEIKREVRDNPKYDKSISNELHKTIQYKDTNRKLTNQKKQGGMKDVYTGKTLKSNQQTDLDHVVSTKEIHNDPGRILAGLKADDLANNEKNLKLVNININRSKKDKTMSDFIEYNKRRQPFLKTRIEKIKADNTLLTDEKQKKIYNVENQLDPDYAKMKKIDKEARKFNEQKINTAYYKDGDFKRNILKQGKNLGVAQAKKQLIGYLLIEIQEFFFTVTIPVLKKWNALANMTERIAAFKQEFENAKENFVSRINEIIDQLLSGVADGFSGGFVSDILNTLINTFLTTSQNFAKLLNDGITGMIKACKILMSNNPDISLNEKIREAMKILSITITASIGYFLKEGLDKYFKTTPLVKYADILSSGIGSIFTGIVASMLIFAFDNFNQILDEFRSILETIKFGILVSKEEIEKAYKEAILRVDDAYQALLFRIEEEYGRIEKLADLAHDMKLLASGQLKNSIVYAKAMGVEDGKLLKTESDIDRFFLS